MGSDCISSSSLIIFLLFTKNELLVFVTQFLFLVLWIVAFLQIRIRSLHDSFSQSWRGLNPGRLDKYLMFEPKSRLPDAVVVRD